MTGVRHPGHEFVQQYEPSFPTSRMAFARCLRDYADFLRRASDENHPPIDLEAICRTFGLTVADAAPFADIQLDGANVDNLGLILIAEDTHHARRRFTLAHELVEKLIVALRGFPYPRDLGEYVEETPRKERLCNRGAADLLMPASHVRDQLRGAEPTLDLASQLVETYHVSFLAAVQAIVRHHASQRAALVVWRLAHKPSDLRGPHDPGQGSLFPVDHRPLPAKAVRVAWSAFPSHLVRRIEPSVRHSSCPTGSHVHEVYHGRAKGPSYERVKIGQLDADCHVDARRVHLGDEPSVISLLTLPADHGPRHPSQPMFT